MMGKKECEKSFKKLILCIKTFSLMSEHVTISVKNTVMSKTLSGHNKKMKKIYF
jgi:hypothetical protein